MGTYENYTIYGLEIEFDCYFVKETILPHDIYDFKELWNEDLEKKITNLN